MKEELNFEILEDWSDGKNSCDWAVQVWQIKGDRYYTRTYCFDDKKTAKKGMKELKKTTKELNKEFLPPLIQ